VVLVGGGGGDGSNDVPRLLAARLSTIAAAAVADND
jgi:hypothetical protein